MRVAEYLTPQSIHEAVGVLGRDPSARPLAGGNSLLVEPSRSGLAGAKLVDLRRIAGLVGVQPRDGGLHIGAMTTLEAVGAAAGSYPALGEAIGSIGDAQVRNRATIGGNLAEADPGVDLPAVMIALGAQIEVQAASGSRVISADELVASRLKPGELITAIIIPAPAPKTGSAYEKFKHPATLYAICGVAASVTLAADGSVAAAAIGLTGAAEAPTRQGGVEAALKGKKPDAATLSAAADQIGDQIKFRGDHFASAEYRRHLSKILTQRALSRAVERAGR